jgi:hypothetical protein
MAIEDAGGVVVGPAVTFKGALDLLAERAGGRCRSAACDDTPATLEHAEGYWLAVATTAPDDDLWAYQTAGHETDRGKRLSVAKSLF